MVVLPIRAVQRHVHPVLQVSTDQTVRVRHRRVHVRIVTPQLVVMEPIYRVVLL